ncbi:MAG: hypothetical protein PHQ00_07695 [Phycisphaerae bacterium]|nr:hypothetical protein [Phycisphaerae bacterium]
MSNTKAHQRYRLKKTAEYPKGEIVPGVTTIVRQLGWNTDVLVAWARREALSGNDPNKIRDEAADSGTVTHKLIESHIIGEKADLSDYTQNQIDKGETGFLAYLEWEKRNAIEYIGSEIQIVSEKYRCGGTIDAIAKKNGVLWLLDFKTSSGIWPEMKVQVAAYKNIYEEINPLNKISECHLLQLNKKDGSFQHHKLSDEQIGNAWIVFKHCRELYDFQKYLK